MATRLYFSSTTTVDITPNFAAFTQTTSMDRREMSVNKSLSAMTSKTQTGAAAVGNTTGMRQYISPPMQAQTLSAGTAKGTIRVLESAVNDNIDNVSLQLRVVDRPGTTFNGTSILALNTYVAVNEFATTLTARRLCDGDATTSVTCSEGDRLVLDLAYRTSAGGTSLSSDFSFGDNSATDLGDNETDTAANNPFLELSINVLWLQPPTWPSKTSPIPKAVAQ